MSTPTHQNPLASITTQPGIPQVDFSYAFATPHRLTVCLPDSSDKTLVDCQAGSLRLAWSYDDQRNKPLAAFTTPATNWEITVTPEVDGHACASTRWSRLDGWMPVLVYVADDGLVSIRMEAIGGPTAMVLRIRVANRDQTPHQVSVSCVKPGGWLGLNPGWIDPDDDRDVLLAGWMDRADRIIVMVAGDADLALRAVSTLCPTWKLAPGDEREIYLIRPYRANHRDLPALRRHDWAQESEAGLAAWRSLLNRCAKVTIPDPGVQWAFQACVADCFVMREPVADGSVVASPGTECYRAPNSFEPLIVSVLFDQLGLHAEARGNTAMFLERQDEHGNWADPDGWVHHMWGASGVKSWAILEHVRLTADTTWLATVFPRMLASSRWQDSRRAKTRVLADGQRSLTYGLMPRGFGDCGLKARDDGHYDYFLPHNILAVAGDALTVAAAEILGRSDVLDEVRRIYAMARNDLLQVLDRGAIAEDGYRWIPGVPGHTCGSRWGALYAAFPCNILAPDHELISGTIRKIEARMSPGGIPVHTGWMKDGMWVAITLDNLAEVLLQRDQKGDADAAVRYLYATLNHGTPLYTWCEERGQEPGAKDCSGDRQHLWTPVAVARFIRDALVMEDGETLHLARGTARHWLEQGKTIATTTAPTHFGVVSFNIVSDVNNRQIKTRVTMPSRKSAKEVCLHLRHPTSAPIKSVTVNGNSWKDFNKDKETVTLKDLTGDVTVTTQY